MHNRFIMGAALLLLLESSAARAAGFDAALELKGGREAQTATSKASTEKSPLPRRPVVEGSADASFTAVWKVSRSAKTDTKDVLVHFYVVKTDRQGQAPPALEPGHVVIECALTMDFPPNQTSAGTQQFRVDGPGVYLVRIEAGADPEKPGTADYAEMELVVK